MEQQLVVGPLEVVRRQQAELRQADGGGAVEFVVEILQAEVAEDVRGVLRLLVGGGDSEGAGRGGSVGGELVALLGVEVVDRWRRQGVHREQGADLAGVFSWWRILGGGWGGPGGGEAEAEYVHPARERSAFGRRSPGRLWRQRVRGPAHPAERSQGGVSRCTVWYWPILSVTSSTVPSGQRTSTSRFAASPVGSVASGSGNSSRGSRAAT